MSASLLLCALAASGQAKIIDPQMGVEQAGDPPPFTGGVTFTPQPDGGGVFPYFNATGGTITSLLFETTITAGLGTQGNPPLPTFQCNNAQDPTVPNPFFLSCEIFYFPETGVLQFKFDGTNTGTGGLDEGIPPLANFAISLNNGYSLTGDVGGWGAANVNFPGFTAEDVQIDPPAPEPASAILVAAALLAGGALFLRGRSRAAIS